MLQVQLLALIVFPFFCPHGIFCRVTSSYVTVAAKQRQTKYGKQRKELCRFRHKASMRHSYIDWSMQIMVQKHTPKNSLLCRPDLICLQLLAPDGTEHQGTLLQLGTPNTRLKLQTGQQSENMVQQSMLNRKRNVRKNLQLDH